MNLTHWPIVRIVHLVASVIILYTAYDFGHNVFLYILGGGFFVQALLGVGCSTTGCARPTQFNYRRRHR